MKNLLNLIVLLTCVTFACESKAVDINEIRGKKIVFKTPINQNMNFDCFFICDLNNPRNSKKVYAPMGKTTDKEEILGHVFSVDSILFKNKHQEISDGTIILLTREDGQKIILKTPPYKNNKRFKVSDKNSFYYSLIKVLYLGQKRNIYASAYTKSYLDVYKSYLDLDVYNVSKSDSIVNDLMKTNKVFSKDNIINIPIIKNHTFYFENNVPFYKLSFETENKIYKIEDLAALDSVRRCKFKEALYVDSIIKANSNLNIDSINEICKGKDFWMSPNILAYDSIPTVHYSNFEHKAKSFFSTIDEKGYKYENVWIYRSSQSYNEGMIGGDSWSFLRGRIESVSILPIILPKSDFYDNYYEKKAKRDNWPRYAYYIKIIPSPTYLYKTGYQEVAYGVNMPDTIYIPFHIKKLKYLLTGKKLNQFEIAFHKMEQEAWNEHMDRALQSLEVLSKVYGKNTAQLISAGKIRFGFTSEMCKLAFSGEPYNISEYSETPFGPALKYYFYTKDIRLYFIDDKLIGIQWKGKAIEYYK